MHPAKTKTNTHYRFPPRFLINFSNVFDLKYRTVKQKQINKQQQHNKN
jgi:hypothetical protein